MIAPYPNALLQIRPYVSKTHKQTYKSEKMDK